MLVDADGLTILAAHPDLVAGRSAPTVLTPHAGEFARLAGSPPGDDRVGAARRLADQLGATVLLKGNVTVIAEPGGRVYINPAGAFVGRHRRIRRRAVRRHRRAAGRGLPAGEAAAVAAFVHARAADLVRPGPRTSAGADVGVGHPRPHPDRPGQSGHL